MTQVPPRSACVLLEGRKFLHPYLERAFKAANYELTICSPQEAPFVFHGPVIALVALDGEVPDSTASVLRFPPAVVGTAMEGPIRTLAEDVASGRFMHVRKLPYPRIQVVHATDLADAAVRLAMASAPPGQWLIDDGETPGIDQLADALAHRMNNKTVMTFPWPFWARLLRIGREWRLIHFDENSGETQPPSFAAEFDFKTHPVCTYLLTHDYDSPDSL